MGHKAVFGLWLARGNSRYGVQWHCTRFVPRDGKWMAPLNGMLHTNMFIQQSGTRMLWLVPGWALRVCDVVTRMLATCLGLKGVEQQMWCRTG